MEIHEGDLGSFTIQQLNKTAAGLLSQLKRTREQLDESTKVLERKRKKQKFLEIKKTSEELLKLKKALADNEQQIKEIDEHIKGMEGNYS